MSRKEAKYVCPDCGRIIYNRRNKTCEFCKAKLPEELLYTVAEIEQLDKERIEAAERNRKEAAKNNPDSHRIDSGFDGFDFLF